MRRLLVVLAVVAFCAAPSWADSIELDVVAWATFTATQPCFSDCTETIATSFKYVPPILAMPGSQVSPTNGEIVPGSLVVASSGFLGSSFSAASLTCNGNCLPFLSSLGDEIDLDVPNMPGLSGIQPGINTVDLFLYGCQSEACDEAFGETWINDGPGQPSRQGSRVTAVVVSDETPFVWLALTAFGTIGLGWRWRRKESSATYR